MAPLVIDLRRTDDPRDVVHRAVQALAEGRLVAFPTETDYVVAASAREAAATVRLRAACGCASPGIPCSPTACGCWPVPWFSRSRAARTSPPP